MSAGTHSSHAGSATLLFAGGGSGGHVFPMIAVADAVGAIAPGVELVFVGTERGLETKIVPARGYRLELLTVEPMRGGGATQAVRGAAQAARSLFSARSLVRRIGPRAVFSIGGYAAGPVAVAARTLGVPLALMEPNSAIGLANRLVAPLVQRAYTGFPESERHFGKGTVLRTGVPIRAGFGPAAYAREGALRVLVLGGSQGAASLNDAVPRALARARVDVRVVHQCGAGKDAAVRALYDELGAADRARVVAFIDDMPAALGAADLVIGRAGAGAIAEICAVGRPSVLVPYPFAGDHQRHNAEFLVRAGAAVCLLAAEADVPRITAELERLAADPALLPAMAHAARDLGRPDAATVIARDLLRLAGLDGEATGGSTSGNSGGRTAASGTGKLAASSAGGSNHPLSARSPRGEHAIWGGSAAGARATDDGSGAAPQATMKRPSRAKTAAARRNVRASGARTADDESGAGSRLSARSAMKSAAMAAVERATKAALRDLEALRLCDWSAQRGSRGHRGSRGKVRDV